MTNRSFVGRAVFVIPFLAILFLFMISCSSKLSALKKKRDNNPTNNISYWGEKWKLSDIKDRIRECPPELIERIKTENEIDGFSERPLSAKPTREIYSALNSIESTMPHNIREILKQRLIGIFIVNKLGGTGYTQVVLDEEGKEKYALIVMDEAVLMSRKANEWATWKENSFFNHSAASGIKIKMVIEHEENNTVTNAIRYIMLHEMGHVLGMVTHAHTSWKEGIEKKKISMDYPFQRFSWKQSGPNSISSLFDEKFPERKYVVEYSFEKSKLSIGQAPSIYEKLHNTSFPSLNGSQNIWEDFAESFATYFHTILDKRPWKVVIEREGSNDILMKDYWDDNRCKEKREFMKRWFENAAI